MDCFPKRIIIKNIQNINERKHVIRKKNTYNDLIEEKNDNRNNNSNGYNFKKNYYILYLIKLN